MTAAIRTGTFGAVLFVAIDVVAEAGAGHDFQVVRRADGVGELEVAVAGDAEVGFQLLVRRAGRSRSPGAAGASFANTFVKNFFRNPIAILSSLSVVNVVSWFGSWGRSCRVCDGDCRLSGESAGELRLYGDRGRPDASRRSAQS